MYQNKIRKLFLVFLLMMAPSISYSVDKVGNGVDIYLMRKANLGAQFVNLQYDLYNFVDKLDDQPTVIKNIEARKFFQELLLKGLKNDIKNSKSYIMKTPCKDKYGIDMNAVSTIGEVNGEICFDLEKMARDNISIPEFFGIAVHEHAHHLGYDDSNKMYLLGMEMAYTYRLLTLSEEISIITDSRDPNKLIHSISAHTNTWIMLFHLSQIKEVFPNAGSIKISNFELWYGSGDQNSFMLAQMIDSYLLNLLGAKRNLIDRNYINLISQLLEYGNRHDKNLRWFADALDELYTFWKEDK